MTQEKKKLSKREKQEISRQEASSRPRITEEIKVTGVPFLYLALVFIFGAVLYVNTLKNGFVLDDFSVISENFIVKKGTKALPEIFTTSYRYGYMSVNDGLYRPLSLALFSIEWNLFKDNTLPYHFINILLYALCGIALLLYLRRLMAEHPPALPLISTLLFLAHPLHTEVAANVKSADELLCFLFSIMTLDLHLRYIERPKVMHYVGLAVLTFLAFLSKESAVLLLALLPAQAFYKNAKGRTFRFQPLLPPLAVFLLVLLIRKAVLGSAFGIQAVTRLDNPLFSEDFITRLLSGCVLMVSYLRQMIFPNPLIFDYSYNAFPVVGSSQWEGYAALSAWLALALLWWYSLKRKPMVAFFIFFFAATLGFYSNIPFAIGAMRAERFTFVAILPFCVGLTRLLMMIPGADLKGGRPLPRGIALGVFTAIILLYSFQTISRNADWKNNETLYRSDLAKESKSAKIRYYLGNELTKNKVESISDSLMKKAVMLEGIGYLRESVQIDPDNSDSYTQIGVAYYKLKQFDSASVNFVRALNLNPSSSTALNNLGSVYFESGQYEKALETYQKVLALFPNFVDSHVNMGSALGMLKRYPEAAVSFQNALALDPENKKALNFLAITYDLMGKKAEAAQIKQKLGQIP